MQWGRGVPGGGVGGGMHWWFTLDQMACSCNIWLSRVHELFAYSCLKWPELRGFFGAMIGLGLKRMKREMGLG